MFNTIQERINQVKTILGEPAYETPPSSYWLAFYGGAPNSGQPALVLLVQRDLDRDSVTHGQFIVSREWWLDQA